MPKIVIYTTRVLPLLPPRQAPTQKRATFEEIDVSGDWAARDALTEKAGGLTTVPQIWIGDTHVGGTDELTRSIAPASSTPCWPVDRTHRLRPSFGMAVPVTASRIAFRAARAGLDDI